MAKNFGQSSRLYLRSYVVVGLFSLSFFALVHYLLYPMAFQGHTVLVIVWVASFLCVSDAVFPLLNVCILACAPPLTIPLTKPHRKRENFIYFIHHMGFHSFIFIHHHSPLCMSTPIVREYPVLRYILPPSPFSPSLSPIIW
jgi:hypothetical protein